MGLTRSDVPCKMSFYVERVSLQNESAKLNPSFCQPLLLFIIPHTFFKKIFGELIPFKKGEDSPAIKGVLMVLTVSPYNEFF